MCKTMTNHVTDADVLAAITTMFEQRIPELTARIEHAALHALHAESFLVEGSPENTAMWVGYRLAMSDILRMIRRRIAVYPASGDSRREARPSVTLGAAEL